MGKVKDVIVRGGYNVWPRQVEEIIYERPAVAEVSIAGVPHEGLDEEEVAALIAPKEVSPPRRRSSLSLKSLSLKRGFARYKYPRCVSFMNDELRLRSPFVRERRHSVGNSS